MITGSGNTKSTPDILLSMLTLNSAMEEPKECTYMAIAEGGKQLNMAKVVSTFFDGLLKCNESLKVTFLLLFSMQVIISVMTRCTQPSLL